MPNTEAEQHVLRKMEKAIDFLGIYMQDDPQLNRLIRKKELDPKRYELAILLSIDDYNISAPVTNYTIINWPSLKMLLQGAAIQFLIMAGMLQSRNRLNYSAGGVSVVVSDKAQEYQAWIQHFVNDYETKKSNFKKFVNIDSGMDGNGFNSEYNNLYGYYW